MTDNFPYSSHYIDVLGSKIHYLDEGHGNPILFLHGMPASSYVWRNIFPHLTTLGRCIAPDLMGMGKSDKPDIEYTIEEHIKYINQFIEKLGLKSITLVMHGWGSIIGFDYAMRNEKNCKGLVFYESYLRPFHKDDLSLPMQEQMIVLQKQKDVINSGADFVENILKQELLQSLKEQDISFYREPFLKNGTGKPLQQYLLELPANNKKSKADTVIAEYSKKLMHSTLPKLMLYSIPGFITTMATAVWAKENFTNLELTDIGEALHFAQESDPIAMGETISVWMQGVEASSSFRR